MLLTVAFLAGVVATGLTQRLFRLHPLQTDAAPYGIVSFELAGTVRRASTIFESWRAEGLLGNVRPNMQVDDRYFIPCYVATLALGCMWASRALGGGSARLVRWIAGAQVVAGLCDYAENRAMLATVTALEASHEPGAGPAIAAAFAVAKFALLAVGILAILAGAAARLRRHR